MTALGLAHPVSALYYSQSSQATYDNILVDISYITQGYMKHLSKVLLIIILFVL